MANFTLSPGPFPVGSTITVYSRRTLVGPAGPIGTPIASGTTSAQLTTPFTGLAYGTEYRAVGLDVYSVLRWVDFTTAPDPAFVDVSQADLLEIVAFSDRLPPALTNMGVPGNGIDGAGPALEALAPGTYSALATDKFRIESECRVPQLINIVGAGETNDPGSAGTIFECVNAGASLVFDIGYGGLSSGFCVDGMGVATTPLKFYICVGRTFENVKARRSSGEGIVMEGCQNNKLKRIHTEDTDGAGFVIDLGCGQNDIDGYEFNDFGTYGIVIRQSAASPVAAATVDWPLNNVFKSGIVEYPKASALGCVLQSAGLNNRFTSNANFQISRGDAVARSAFRVENGGGGYLNGELVLDGIVAGGDVADTFLYVVTIAAGRAARLSGVNYVNSFLHGVRYAAGQYGLIDLVEEPNYNGVTNRWTHGDALGGYIGGAPEYWFVNRPSYRSLTLEAVEAVSVPNNSVFRDLADNVVKVKNNAGVVTAI